MIKHFVLFAMIAVHATERIRIEGTLFKANLECFLTAPQRRIRVSTPPCWLLLPDSLISIKGQYPAVFWIDKSSPELETKHVCVEGTVQECLSGEFLVHATQITECLPSASSVQSSKLSEEEIDYWEDQIPLMAQAVFQRKALQVLLQGFSVVGVRDDALWTFHPDGTETFIKDIPPGVPVTRNEILYLQE